MGLPFLSKENPMKKDAQSGLVKSWSNSTLNDFLECQYRIYLKKVKKVRVIPAEAQEDEKPKANERGNELHNITEEYIKGIIPVLPAKIKHRRELIEHYRRLYEEGEVKICIEEEWAFGTEWDEMEWGDKNAWARIKIDAMAFDSETSARIDDWKSGKKYGNEGKHLRQVMTYVCAAFLKFPKLQHIKGSMQYIDQASDNILTRDVSRERAMTYLSKLENQALAMTTCTDFKPCPNKHNCQFCEFSEIIPNTRERYCEFSVKEL